MSNVYAYWHARLAKRDPKPFVLPTIEGNPNDDPQPGLYKVRLAKGAAKVPMQIWVVKDGKAQNEWSEGCELAGTIDGKPANARALSDRWLFAEPISKSDMEYYKANNMWPGDIGHNSGDLSLAEEIADAAKTALEWLKSSGIKDQTTLNMAANYRAKLNELAKRADDERDSKKRPHMEAAKAVDAEYKPLVVEAKDAADTLRDALTEFMRAEEARLRAEQEAKRKAAEEAARKQREAAEAARKTAEAQNLPLPPEPEDVPLPMFDEPVKVQAGGQRGRKAGLRTVVEYQIHDRAALLAYLTTHDNADLHAAAAEIGRKLFKAGVEVPGIIAVGKKVAA